MVRKVWNRGGELVDRGSRAILMGGVLLLAGSGGPLTSGEDRGSLSGPPVVRAGSPDERPIVLAAVTDPAAIEQRIASPSLPAPAEVAPEIVSVAENQVSGAAPVVETWQEAAVRPAPEPKVEWTVATPGDLVAETPKPQISPPLPPRALLKPAPANNLPASVLGTWVPNRDACADPASTDYLPLVIGRNAARAGDGSCAFLTRKQVGKAFKVTAECTDGTTNWSANVTLSVVNRRLTWASERGTETYERCEKAPVVASAPKPARVAAARKPARVAKAEPKTATVRITSGAGPTQLVTVLRR